MKMRVAVATVLVMFFAVTTAYAAFPNSFWAPLEQYNQAMQNGDDVRIMECGAAVAAVAEAMPDDMAVVGERTQFLATCYETMARAAERLGWNDKVLEYNQKYIPYGAAMGWDDGVLFAKNKIEIYTPIFKVYGETQADTAPYYGAKFEPRRGMLYGATYDADPRIGTFDHNATRQYFPKDESVYLIYMEWGEDPNTSGRFAKYFNDAAAHGKSVEFAWNTYYPLNIAEHGEYVDSVLRYLSETNVDIFLRFGAEMNLGDNGSDSGRFIESFRYVADRARQYNNIAMVWSPGDIGALDRPFELYYPGDAYVDWVGVSSYTNKYFMGDKAGFEGDISNTYFYTGKFASPFLRIKQIVSFMQANNIQKPLMISEGGIQHTYNYDGEDTTDFGLPLFYDTYAELYKLYPQIKLMCYFNVSMNEPANYSIFDSDIWQRVYNELVADSFFIPRYGADAPYSYQEITGGVATNRLSAVFYYPKEQNLTVRYSINGKVISEVPSPYNFDIPQLSGELFITAEGICAGNKLFEYTYKSSGGVVAPVQGDGSIGVYYNGQRVAFPDQQPAIEEGRTLIPVRGVFEQMGATVDWDADTSTATISRENTQIKVQIGNNIMQVNGAPLELDVPAQLIGGRTMVPLRAISQALGAEIGWVGAVSAVMISE